MRPIAFMLQRGNVLSTPVTLKIRPEDLSRPEPSRTTVTQTLGRDISGWVDNFGQSLPSVNISGHTGWRTSAGSGEDGVQAFERLNKVVMPDYHKAKQQAIDSGLDPATVKLIFIDMLDGFAWNVAPMQFVLRRSKSRPLLMQYTIQLQAISTRVDTQFRAVPILGSFPAGLLSLDGVLGKLVNFAKQVQSWVAQAIAFKDAVLAPIAATVKLFAAIANLVFSVVRSVVNSVKALISSTANSLISIAKDLASVAVSVFRTISAIAELPAHLRAAISSVAAAYNEVVCLFSNSLKPANYYEDYDGLYGASNCSSTTGGRPESRYANMNAFALMQEDPLPVYVSSGAFSAMQSVIVADPVLAPMPLQEIGRNLQIINDGVRVAA